MAEVVLNFTSLTPVKFVPVIVTREPTTPLVGVNEVTVGTIGTVTVKFVALCPVPPPVVTLILPVVAPVGTVAVIWVAELMVNVVAEVVLNLTSLAPLKLAPEIVTCVPTGPLVGVNEVIFGRAGPPPEV